jgi:hypothetical protein
MQTKVLTGQTFGKWKVIRYENAQTDSANARMICKCECGEERSVLAKSLLGGTSKSCNRCAHRKPTNTYLDLGDGTCYVYCTDRSFFIIDTEDLSFVKQYQWWIDTRGYPKTKYLNHAVLLSRLLLGLENAGRSVFVDHISGDTTDNRRANLRQCFPEENIKNRKLNATNTTGYKGVSYHRKLGKYMAGIRARGHKTIYLGCYPTAEEAAAVYDRAALIYHGEFARTNAQLGLLGDLDEHSKTIRACPD